MKHLFFIIVHYCPCLIVMLTNDGKTLYNLLCVQILHLKVRPGPLSCTTSLLLLARALHKARISLFTLVSTFGVDLHHWGLDVHLPVRSVVNTDALTDCFLGLKQEILLEMCEHPTKLSSTSYP